MVKSNLKAFTLLLLPFALATLFLATLHATWPLYLLGQMCGAIFLAQAFILIHEFGHNSLFKSKWLNDVFGQIISLFVFIPFYNWKLVHDLHHKWTGWRDRDPTTEKTFSKRLTVFQQSLINFCWKYHVPLFTLGYRFGIYWKAEKLKRHLPKNEYQLCLANMLLMAAAYVILAVIMGKTLLLMAPAFYVSFICTDVLSLSQHSNIEMPIAGEQQVAPLKFQEQARYSRSLILPPLIAEYVFFNINYHESHHCYPGLPCYHLPKVKSGSQNIYSFWPWLKTVKRLAGVDFIFTTSTDRSRY